jgi:hypothetical protein
MHLADCHRNKIVLGTRPETTAHQMYQEMVASDLQEAKRHALLKADSSRVLVSAESIWGGFLVIVAFSDSGIEIIKATPH